MFLRTITVAAVLGISAATQATPVHYVAPGPGGFCRAAWISDDDAGPVFTRATADFTYDDATGALSIASWKTYTTDGQLLYSLPPLSATLTTPHIGVGKTLYTSPGEIRLWTIPERNWYSLQVIFYPTAHGIDPTTTADIFSPQPDATWHLRYFDAGIPEPPSAALLAVAAIGGVALLRRRG